MKRKDLLSESDLSDNLENSSSIWYNEDLHCCSRDSDKYTQNLKYISSPEGWNELKHVASMFKSLSVIINHYDYGYFGRPFDGYKLSTKSYNYSCAGKTLLDYTYINYWGD